MIFRQNLKYLRTKARLNQTQLAAQLGCTRSTYRDYETGRTEPDLALIIRISDYFSVSLDKLVRENLENLDKLSIKYRDAASIKSNQLRILTTTVDAAGRENVEIVPVRAKAGYIAGFTDHEFIESLPKMRLPNLPSGTHRGFELEGDSMLPLAPGALVIARYVEHAEDLKDDKEYVVVTRDGIVFKRIRRTNGSMQMVSFNPFYPPYEVPLEDIMEAWQYYGYFDVSPLSHSLSLDHLQREIQGLNEKVDRLLKE
jgi:transcriptional regulator with XRE-family HTH domain